MATPKTAAELQADADRKRAEEDRAQVEKERRQAGFFDWIGNLFSGFNIGTILMMALVIGGIYIAAKMNPEWAEKLVEMLPEKWQANVGGLLGKIGIDVDLSGMLEAMPLVEFKTKLKDANIPDGIGAIIAKDDATKKQFLADVKEANGGKIALSSFTNDATLFHFATKRPQMAIDLAGAAANLPADGKGGDTAKQILGSFKKIVNDERLDVLLSETHRANTFKILSASIPKNVPLNADAIATVITKGIGADGKPTKELRDVLNAALDGDMNKLFTLSLAGTPVSTLLSVVDKNKVTNPDAKLIIAELQSPAGSKALDALSVKLGPQESAKLITSLMGDTAGNNTLQLLLQPQNVHAMPEMLALVNQLPSLNKQVPFKLTALSNLISTTGLVDGKPNAALTTLLTTISQQKTLSAETALPALTTYILTPEVANNPATANAARAVIASIDQSGMNAAEKTQLANIQKIITPQGLHAASTIQFKNNVDVVKLGSAFVVGSDSNPYQVAQNAVYISLNAKARHTVELAGTENLATIAAPLNGFVTKKNLDAMMTHGATLGSIEGNQKNAQRTLDVVTGFTNLAQGMKADRATVMIDAKELSGFFATPGNVAAYKTLFKELDRSVMTKAQAAKVDYIATHFDEFAKLCKTEKDAQLMLDLLRGKDAGILGKLANMNDWTREQALNMQGGAIKEHSKMLIEFRNLMLADATPVARTPNAPPRGSYELVGR